MDSCNASSLNCSQDKDYLLDEFKVYEVSAKIFFLHLLNEIHREAITNNVNCLKQKNKLISYFIPAKGSNELQEYYKDSNNLLKTTNIVILGCKHGNLSVVDYVFSTEGRNLYLLPLLVGLESVKPNDLDDECHNVFYYAIRSGNCQLLETVIHKWPGDITKKEQDEYLSLAYRELKLKQVPLNQEMEVFVARRLLDLRFFASQSVQMKQITIEHIRDRIGFVMECVDTLKREYLHKNPDETFVFIVKFIARNIFILKGGLRSTYATIPWEEIYFFLIAFISSITNCNHIKVFSPFLTKRNLLKHLINFSVCLKIEMAEIKSLTKLSLMPRRKRDAVVESITGKYDFFKELYRDSIQIRDIYSLNVISYYIDLALSTHFDTKNRYLVIARSIQVIGENLKDTVESPKLSKATSDLLMHSLSGWTKQIISDTRDALSKSKTLSSRVKMEQNSDGEFFSNISHDFQKFKSAVTSILFIKKAEILQEVFKKIADGESDSEMKEILKLFFATKWDDIAREDQTYENLNEVKSYLAQISDMILKKSNEEAQLFEKIHRVLDDEFHNADLSKYNYFIYESQLKATKEIYDFKSKFTDFPLKQFAENILSTMPENRSSIKFSTLLKEIIAISVKKIKNEKGLEALYKLSSAMLFKMPNLEYMREISVTLTKSFNKQHPVSSLGQDETVNTLTLESMSNLKKILEPSDSFNILEEGSMLLNKSNHEKAAKEMYLLDILNVALASEKLPRNICFLDNDCPLLVGKNLRDHLAHGNVLEDILFFETSTIVDLNLRIFISKGSSQFNRLIGQRMRSDIFAIRKNYHRDLRIISNQQDLFKLLEVGDIPNAEICLKKGADIKGRNTFSRNGFHFAAIGSSRNILSFLTRYHSELDCKDINGKTPLHIASERGNIEIVKFLLEQRNVKVDETDFCGRTPLHYAVMNGHFNVVKILLHYGAELNILDNFNGLPQHYAAFNNCVKIFEFISEKEGVLRADFLHTASWTGSKETVELLLKKGLDINQENFLGQTPLHMAVRAGQSDMVKLLTEKGANVNTRETNGDTPLITASWFGQYDIVESLLEARGMISASNIRGYEPLHNAAEQGHMKIVELLVKNKASVNSKTLSGETPLILASMKGHEDIVNYLLRNGSFVNESTEMGDTALHFSAYHGYYKIATLLLEYGADANACDLKYTPLHFAVQASRADILKILLKREFLLNIDAENSKLQTALYIASSVGSMECFEVLVKAGVFIHPNKSITNCHLIHHCAKGGNSKIMQFLINAGVDANASDENRNTPMHYAISYNNIDVVKVLIESGAFLNIKNGNNITPFDLAATNNNLEIMQLLISKNDDLKAYIQPLAIAIKEGYCDIVTLLLKIKTLDVNLFIEAGEELATRVLEDNAFRALLMLKGNISDLKNEKYSILHIATMHANAGVIRILIKRNANVNAQTLVLKETPLIMASESGHHKIVKILLHKMADPNISDSFKKTPLHHAAKRGHVKVIEKLLKKKADINSKDLDGRTPLFWAIIENHLPVVKLLLTQKDVELDCGIFKFSKKHPLLSDSFVFSTFAHDKRMVEFFCQECDKETFTSFSSILLMTAIRNGSIEVVKYLIHLDADVSDKFRNVLPSTPLHFASIQNKGCIVNELISSGAYYDCYDGFNTKAWEGRENKSKSKLAATKHLYDAVECNDLRKVQTSIKKGAYVNAKSVEESTPLLNAIWKNHHEIEDILLENNADPNCTGKNDYSPLHCAAFFGNVKAAVSLLSYGAVYNSLSCRNNTPMDFLQNEDIYSLLNLIHECFQSVHKGTKRVISLLEGLDDRSIIRAVMKCHNRERRTLLMEAVHCNYPKAGQLEHVHLKDLTIFLVWGKLLFNAGKYDQALNIHRLILKECEFLLGKSSFNWLEVQESIGIIIHEQQKYDLALSIFQDTYSKRKQMMGEENFATLHAKALIAMVLYSQEKYQESLDILNYVHCKQKTIPKKGSECLFFYQKFIALVYKKLKRFNDALTLCRNLLESKENIFGEFCPFTLSIQSVIASVYHAQHKLSMALDIYKEIYAKQKIIVGPYHIDTLKTLQKIGDVFSDLRQNQEAKEAYFDTLLPQLDIFGKDHLECLLTVYRMANLFHLNNNYSKAYGAYHYILPKLQAIVDESHPVIKSILRNMKKLEITFQSMYVDQAFEVAKRISEEYSEWFETNPIKWYVPKSFYKEQLLFMESKTQVNDWERRNFKIYW